MAGVDEFAVESYKDRVARLHADQASLRNRERIGRFRLALDDSTDAIPVYGWTIQDGEGTGGLRA